MNNNKTGKSRKKVLFLLMLLMILGITGYGVYSYYWTSGGFEGQETISISPFNPETIISSSSDFLGHGGTVGLSCPDTSSGEGSTTCTGSLTIKNSGDTSVVIEVENSSSHSNYEKELYASFNDNPSFSWNTKTLAPGESSVLNISVPLTLSSCYADDNDGCFISSEMEDPGDQYSVQTHIFASFSLKATQVHD